MVQLVKALCYKPEVRRFDFRFFIKIYNSQTHYDHGVNSDSNRNDYQEHFLGEGV
jgi:hypothetical protein